MSEIRNQNTPTNILLDQLSVEVHAARSKGMKLWEEKLQVLIRPKPRFIPRFVWQLLIGILLVQKHTINTEVFTKMGGQTTEDVIKNGPKTGAALSLIDPRKAAPRQ